MYNVGVLRPGETVWRVVCWTWSRPYALRVARKWRKRGCRAFVEEIQQD